MPANNSWITRMLHDLQSSPDAFSKLYEEMKKPLYVVAYRMVLSREDAEDIVQEVFVSLLRAANLSKVKNGRAYLFQTVRNEARKRIRLGSKEIAEGDFEKLTKIKRLAENNRSVRGNNDLDLALAELTAEIGRAHGTSRNCGAWVCGNCTHHRAFHGDGLSEVPRGDPQPAGVFRQGAGQKGVYR